MKLKLTLMCDNEDDNVQCANHKVTCPSGIFSDLRIGRATLEREALTAGWVRKAAKMRAGDGGVIYRTQQAMYCAACARRLL